MKYLVLVVMICGGIFIVQKIIHRIQLKILKKRNKREKYYTPKLSSLHGKDFTNYIDDLKKGLH